MTTTPRLLDSCGDITSCVNEVPLLAELTYRNYAANRERFPEIEPNRWELAYGSATPEMERRYQGDLAARRIFHCAEIRQSHARVCKKCDFFECICAVLAYQKQDDEPEATEACGECGMFPCACEDGL